MTQLFFWYIFMKDDTNLQKEKDTGKGNSI